MDNKYQHFVPQFYLRNFSENGRSIGGYLLKERKFIPHMPIKDMCGRDYLYGEDLELEKWFSRLESNWAVLLRKIIDQIDLSLSYEEWAYLYMFVFLTDARNGFMADSANDMTTKTAQLIAKISRDHGRINATDEEIKQLRFKSNIPNLPHIQSMPKIINIMMDLKPLLLYNTTNRMFITSDYPVVKYNYLFVARNYHRNYGYGQIGTQIYIPINSTLCLMLFDSAVYTINDNNLVLKINAPDQIAELNKLFASNSKRAIYFHNTAREWVIERYVKGIKDTSADLGNQILENRAGEFIIQVSSPSIFSKRKLNFCTINPYFLTCPFPTHMAGPLRPPVEEILNQESKEPTPLPNLSDNLFRVSKLFE